MPGLFLVLLIYWVGAAYLSFCYPWIFFEMRLKQQERVFFFQERVLLFTWRGPQILRSRNRNMELLFLITFWLALSLHFGRICESLPANNFQLISTHQNIYVKAGQTVQLPCEVQTTDGQPIISGEGPPPAQWKHITPQQSKILTNDDHATLTITNTQLSDGGEYECNIRTVGSVKHNLFVLPGEYPGRDHPEGRRESDAKIPPVSGILAQFALKLVAISIKYLL